MRHDREETAEDVVEAHAVNGMPRPDHRVSETGNVAAHRRGVRLALLAERRLSQAAQLAVVDQELS